MVATFKPIFPARWTQYRRGLMATVVILSSFTLISPTIAQTRLAQNPFGREMSQCRAVLKAEDLDSRINLRSGPGVEYAKVGYGLVGDRVFVLTQGPPEVDYEKDSEGYGWYRVGFPRSGAKGWIREDFLQVKCSPIND